MNFAIPAIYAEVIYKNGETWVFNAIWYRWFLDVTNLLSKGYTGSVTVAKITGGGTDGTLTFTNGVLTTVVAPT